jgi:hypothetical protein
VTLLAHGIIKEWGRIFDMTFISKVYSANLANVEHGTTNGTSITITRVGSTLKDAMRVRSLGRSFIFSQVDLAVNQLHAIGVAHCDICVDNVFVDSVADGGTVFLGDLEYCRSTESPPPVGIKRAHNVATARELDLAQLEVFRDELALL